MSVKKLSFTLLCLYMAGMTVQYLDVRLYAVNSALMYAFILVSLVYLIIVRKTLLLSNYMKIYFVFIIASACSMLYSPDKSSNTLYTMIVCFVLCCLSTQIIDSEEKIEKLMVWYSIGTVILILGLFANGSIVLGAYNRFGGELTGNANTFSALYMFGACFSAFFIVKSEKYKKLVYICFYVLQMFAMVIAGGRKYPVIALIVLYFLLVLKENRHSRIKIVKYTLIAALIGVALWVLIMKVPFFYQNIGYRFETMFAENKDSSSVIRSEMMVYGFRGWLNSPIWGNGFNSFSSMSTWKTYSHNNYVELLFNQGIIGFAIYYGGLIVILKRLFQLNSKSLMRSFLLAISIAMFVFDYGAVSYNMVMVQLIFALASVSIWLIGVDEGVYEDA